MKKNTNSFDVCIIGGGPAGLMSACSAGERGAKILILEKNSELGKKLLISGGGRCNLTNANPNHREFISKFGKKGERLFSPFSIFGVSETLKFFSDLGLETKTEAGFRVFPKTDNSADVLEILVNKAKSLGIEFKLSSEVSGFKIDKKNKQILSVILRNDDEIKAKNFILATGGLSHPETGSTGDGFKWLKEIGHKIIPANPSLVPIKIAEPWISELAGIALDNVAISLFFLSAVAEKENKKILNKKGRILFTHNGLSGPTILNMSKSIGELLEYTKSGEGETDSRVIISLDFFPGIGLDKMHEKLKEIFEINLNKKIKNLSFSEIPEKIFLVILRELEIDPNCEINNIHREKRLALIDKFKRFEMTVSGLLGYDKAIISSGGLDLDEVDFKTMNSKLYSNLYLVGDILDFDRPSGGYSLQLCWTTGYLAGKCLKLIK